VKDIDWIWMQEYRNSALPNITRRLKLKREANAGHLPQRQHQQLEKQRAERLVQAKPKEATRVCNPKHLGPPLSLFGRGKIISTS
jgi:hypothetical protein